MIAAVTTVKDEADIIGATVRHMLGQGVDHVWVMDWLSTDGTREILAEIDNVTVVDGSPLPFYWAHQGTYIQHLADMAGADWIVPFDADEYWTGTHDQTIAEALSAVNTDQVHAKIHQYIDFNHRSLREYPWTKVAYKYGPGITICPGNHLISGRNGPADDDALLVHELKFRSFEQFECKLRRRVPWDPSHDGQPGAPGDSPGMVIGGTRTVFLRQMTPDELLGHWDWLHDEIEECAIPSEFRP